jgi:hypothetical protein
MKKIIFFVIPIMIAVTLIFYFYASDDFSFGVFGEKTYKFKSGENLDLNLLEKTEFYCDGIITYNNQKIVYSNYDGSIVWENKNGSFSKRVFISGDYVYRCLESGIEMIDKNSRSYIFAEISGEILNVSRENNRTYIISRQNSGKNTIYILDENNKIIAEKDYDEMITGISLSDKSEGYCLVTLNFESGKAANKLCFNLLDNVELWSAFFENEIIVDTDVINNNVVAIGTKNIYYYNNNGRLMWKNSNYNRMKDYKIDGENKRIYLTYEQDGKIELILYNFEGKVQEIYATPDKSDRLKVSGGSLFVYNDNEIYIFNSNKFDIMIDDGQGKILDFKKEGNKLYILTEDKLMKGQIK